MPEKSRIINDVIGSSQSPAGLFKPAALGPSPVRLRGLFTVRRKSLDLVICDQFTGKSTAWRRRHTSSVDPFRVWRPGRGQRYLAANRLTGSVPPRTFFFCRAGDLPEDICHPAAQRWMQLAPSWRACGTRSDTSRLVAAAGNRNVLLID